MNPFLLRIGSAFLFSCLFVLDGLAQSGIITTVAGNGTQGFNGDGGQATSAQLYRPSGVAVDAAGNLYIADSGNQRIRKVTPTGVITTVAGNGTQDFGGDGSLATSTPLNAPGDVAVDAAGNLYIADTNNERVRRVPPAGIISTVAGTATWGFSGDGGSATSAQLSAPEDVTVDAAGNLYIVDRGNQRIRQVTPAGLIYTVAGGAPWYGQIGDGGAAASALLYNPHGVVMDTGGNLFIADSDHNRVRNVPLEVSLATFFPQVAVGGGYSTLFTITNTGATAALGTLILWNPQGNALTASGLLTDSLGTTQPAFAGSSFGLTVPAAGSVFLLATAVNPNGPTTTGWAQLESTGGVLAGAATFEYAAGEIIQNMAGVLQTQLLQFATIPVDNDDTHAKQMAYAIANPSSQTISIKLALVNQNGFVVDDTLTVTLAPGQQIARYVWQDLARANFKGSLVLRGQDGMSFIAVGLLQKQGLFTVIPLIPGKAPGIPN